ncbi:kinase-like domain-containing protein [Annulohypoxylon bovei var. microspora]|nr:kinase-like domain-containing protein [Annulohypoxylon bovei var. microspora]
MKFLLITADTKTTKKAIGRSFKFIQKNPTLHHHRFLQYNVADEDAHFCLEVAQKVEALYPTWAFGPGSSTIQRTDVDILIDPGCRKVPAIVGMLYFDPGSGQLMLEASSETCPITYLSGSWKGTDIILKKGDPAVVLHKPSNRIRYGPKPLDLVLSYSIDDNAEFIRQRNALLHSISGSIPDPRFDASPQDTHYKIHDIVVHCKVVGAGGFGRVTNGVLIFGGKPVAIKKVAIHNARDLDLLIREIEISSSLRHDNVVTVQITWCEHGNRPACRSVNPDVYYLVMPMAVVDFNTFFLTGDLKDPAIRLRLFKDAASGLSYLHDQGIMHRDISIKNLLVAWDTQSSRLIAKICDFGKAIRSSTGEDQQLGPRHTIAPEVGGSIYTRAIDVWSLGYAHYVCLTRNLPHDNVRISRERHTDMINLLDDYLNQGAIGEYEHDLLTKGELQWDGDQRLTPSEILGHHAFAEIQD